MTRLQSEPSNPKPATGVPTKMAQPQFPMIRVYNTLSKNKETFEPVAPGKVGIYLCGPTVYKPSHIGHMVGPTIFDAIKRFLVYSGYQVKLVINITDVDDKLIGESNKRGITMQAVAEEMTADYMRNLAAMGIDTVDSFPKATDYIAAIIEFCQDLIAKGFAYASDGDVYFDVTKFAEYGKLSHRHADEMIGEGGSTADRKRSSGDFALWKKAKPGEPSWDSPWGRGRPGWHIECSVMSSKLLGETFDIHGGGLDLVFPHHENEVAQSECRFGKPPAKYWLHNGLMQASSEVGKLGGRNTREAEAGTEADQAAQEAGKMGKSKGASAFRDLLQKYPGETIRFFLLSTHYRRPIDYSEARIDEVQTGLQQFYRFFQRLERVAGQSFYQLDYTKKRAEVKPADDELLKTCQERRAKFLEFMDDDFNTGGAVAELFEVLRALNRFVDNEKLDDPAQRSAEKIATLIAGTKVLRELAATIGMFQAPVATSAPAGGDDALVAKLMELVIELRAEARKTKNFATADKIRNALTAANIVLEDRPDGTGWSVKK